MAAAAPRIRVVIVDDQALFVSGMQMLLESQPDLEVVGTASDGLSGVEVVQRTNPDIVLMDIRMPVLDGIEATARIVATTGADPQPGEPQPGEPDGERQNDEPPNDERQNGEPQNVVFQEADGTKPRVIILTTFQRDEAVYRAIRTGASGFITKDATPEFILAAIRTVHSGKAVLAPKATFDLVSEFAAAPERSGRPLEFAIEALSPREREIFLLTARGLSNAEIATAAFVSEATVKSHVRAILSKLSLQSRVQVVIYAYENGLLTY
jgi:DNA-binding NarL/FixJ family response regulator